MALGRSRALSRVLGRAAPALLAATLLFAQSGEAAKPGAPPAVTLGKGTIDKLKSADAADIKAGLDDARLVGKGAAAAAPIIIDLLDKGLPFPLTENAIDTLGDIEAPAASAAIAPYARHRKVEIRRSAVRALGRTGGPAAIKALRAALSDEDGGVRGYAATGLGALHAREAVADLFVALDHKVNEAAASIGQLCAPSDCDALQGRLGRLPFDVVTSGLEQVLFRPPAEVSDDAKVKLLGRVRELGTAEANRFLKDVQGRWPQTSSARVKQAIDQGVQATTGAAGTTGTATAGGSP